MSEARRWIDEPDRHEGDDPTAALPLWGDWPERPVCRLLLAEASKVVNGPRL